MLQRRAQSVTKLRSGFERRGRARYRSGSKSASTTEMRDVALTPAAYRSRARTLAREAARRDRKDDVANEPIDRAEARARRIGAAAWQDHFQRKSVTAVRAALGVDPDGTEQPIAVPAPVENIVATASAIPSTQTTFSRGDRVAVSLLLIPLVLAASAISAMKAINATTLQDMPPQNGTLTRAERANSTDSKLIPSASNSALTGALTTPAMTAAPSQSRVPWSSGEAVAALTIPEPAVLSEVPAKDLAASDPAATLIPAIAKESEIFGGRDRRCAIEEQPIAPGLALLSALAKSDASATDFGRALAEAAEQQLGEFVVYTDSYKRLSFPMGDIPSLFGVCTDVVIRAYRTVGIDLQKLVHKSRVGSGDPNIDHRRTEVLRRFFAANGRSLPVTDVADDYLPGDIVTYHRPQNSGSQSHIAIVSTERAASGRPLIVHNRGWGPQLEDGLFVDQITGHYRYRGRGELKVSQSIAQSGAAPIAKSVTLPRKTLASKVKFRFLKKAVERQQSRERERPAKSPSGS